MHSDFWDFVQYWRRTELTAGDDNAIKISYFFTSGPWWSCTRGGQGDARYRVSLWQRLVRVHEGQAACPNKWRRVDLPAEKHGHKACINMAEAKKLGER